MINCIDIDVQIVPSTDLTLNINSPSVAIDVAPAPSIDINLITAPNLTIQAVNGPIINFEITGPAGPPGASSQLKQQVLPLESPDGNRTVFTVPNIFEAGSLAVSLNGLNEGYITILNTTQFEFDTAPYVGDIVLLSYAVA